MTPSIRRSAFLALLAVSPVVGQGPILTGAGYSNPSIIRVAPGQITTLFVAGLKPLRPGDELSAAAVPLPVRLAGVAVTLNQPGAEAIPVPLLALRQTDICSDPGVASPPADAAADCLMTAVTVQIPFELVPAAPIARGEAANQPRRGPGQGLQNLAGFLQLARPQLVRYVSSTGRPADAAGS